MHCELCLSEHTDDMLCSNVHWTQHGPLPHGPVADGARSPTPPTRPLQPPSEPVGETASGGEPAREAEPAREPDRAPDLVGQTLGHYRLVKQLGSGGMGTVYLAEQTRIGARVAVKVLHPHLSRDEHLRGRFYAEARTVNLVGHPHIVHIFDISEAPGGLHYFVMEYLEGVPLSRLPRPLSPGPLVRLLAQACDALEAAHRAGVVHRDLKPDNLFVVRRLGEPPSLKVLDFGVAKARRAAGDGEETAVGLVLGTPAYMPPEQWAGQAVDGRADIYALAVTAYLSLTGRLPYARGQVAELVLSSNPPGPVPPHKLNPRVPVALSEVLLRALARFPDERFPTAADFKRALLAAVAVPKPPRPVSAEPLAPPPVEAPRRTPRPPVTPPPVRAEAAETATPPPSWTAKVQRGAGASAVEVRCTQLSRGGLFMCCAEPFPQLFSRVAFTLQLGGEEHSCVGEVVQHVGTDLARAWGTSSGVGVQFINPPPRLRELVQRLQPVRPSPPQSLPPPVRASGMGRS